jgi:NADH:ubiquinone oxidoreductase subunit 3 (subunit A)
MVNELAQTKQDVLLDQYEVLYNDYVADVQLARYKQASKTQKALDTIYADIFDDLSEKPPYDAEELRRRMDQLPTATAQKNTTHLQMDVYKMQYYMTAFLVVVVTLLLVGAYRSTRLQTIGIVAFVALLVFFLLGYYDF